MPNIHHKLIVANVVLWKVWFLMYVCYHLRLR